MPVERRVLVGDHHPRRHRDGTWCGQHLAPGRRGAHAARVGSTADRSPPVVRMRPTRTARAAATIRAAGHVCRRRTAREAPSSRHQGRRSRAWKNTDPPSATQLRGARRTRVMPIRRAWNKRTAEITSGPSHRAVGERGQHRAQDIEQSPRQPRRPTRARGPGVPHERGARSPPEVSTAGTTTSDEQLPERRRQRASDPPRPRGP